VVTNGGSAAAMARARYGSMKRGLSGQKTKPIARAPASTAATASSTRVMPQIFTSTGTPPAPNARHEHDRRKGRTEIGSWPGLRAGCVSCGSAAGLQQSLERPSRVLRGHELLADQKRPEAEGAQFSDLIRALQTAFTDGHDMGGDAGNQRL